MLHQDAEERHKFLNGVKNYGRNLVWRAQDEKSVYPNDAERAFVLAFKRGLREYHTNPTSPRSGPLAGMSNNQAPSSSASTPARESTSFSCSSALFGAAS